MYKYLKVERILVGRVVRLQGRWDRRKRDAHTNQLIGVYGCLKRPKSLVF